MYSTYLEQGTMQIVQEHDKTRFVIYVICFWLLFPAKQI